MRNDSESAKKYTDTPMWNSTLSYKIYPIINPNGIDHMAHFLSPCEVEDLSALADAYVEVAEFDCLRDDGLTYQKRLSEAGVNAVLNDTVGTMHAFDIVLDAPTTRRAVEARIGYMKSKFYKQS
jgi:acetyl esterase/lipase